MTKIRRTKIALVFLFKFLISLLITILRAVRDKTFSSLFNDSLAWNFLNYPLIEYFVFGNIIMFWIVFKTLSYSLSFAIWPERKLVKTFGFSPWYSSFRGRLCYNVTFCTWVILSTKRACWIRRARIFWIAAVSVADNV